MSKMLWSAVFMALLLSGCGWNGTPTRGDDFSPVTSITISADYSTIAKGTSVKLKATGHVSGLGSRDLTDKVTWSSSDTTKASFNSTVFPGRVTGVNVGAISITATYGTLLSAPYTLTVSGATISSIVVTPTAPSVAKGLSQKFAAIGTFSDSTTQDISLDSGWTSSATGFVTVSDAEISKGLAKAVDVGSSTISATFNSIAGSTELTVTKAVMQSIAVTPINPTILSLSTKNFTATGNYSDGSTADITSSATWSSSNADCATITGSGGLATTLAQGSATISAKLDSISGNSALTVTGGTLSSIAVTPLAVTLGKETKTRIKAVGTFTNGTVISTRDITGAVTWTTADPALATVTAGGGNLEWLNAVAATPGTTITATAPTAISTGKTGTATLTVTSPMLSSITLSPSTVGLTVATSTPLSVIASFNDGTNQDVTALSTYTTSDETKATVGASGLSAGRVTAVAAGPATISASYGDKTAPNPATVTVVSRTLQSLTISGSLSVPVGNQVLYTAKAVYAGSSTEYDVTEDTEWSITPTNVAALADSVNQKGQIVAISSGTTTLTATFDGKTPTVTITVP